MSYTRPGAYVERIASVSTPTSTQSTSIAGFIGDTVRGIPNKAIKVTSWSQFEQKFAKGISNPFVTGHVADAVYGFFANGGSELYVVRTVEEGSVKASAVIPTSTGVSFEAVEEGEWGNDISITIKQDTRLKSSTFTLTVTLQGNKVEELKGLSSANFKDVINSTSEYIRVAEANENPLASGTGTLDNGSSASLNSASYKKGLTCFDVVPNVNILAIPGVTEVGVQEALVEYCDLRGNVFPIVDVPAKTDISALMTYKEKFSSHVGAIYYPRIEVIDPVTGKNKIVAPSGHLAGMYARTDKLRGIHKSPAGAEATLKGAIGVETNLTEAEMGSLNSANINCIVPKTGCGIVPWGARLLKVNGDRQFISDLRLDIFVEESIRALTEWAIFEPIDEQLFNELNGQLCDFFNSLMAKGNIKGSTPEEAYFVVCDDTINTDPNSSTVEIEVGYARKKPAEFVVTRISQMREV